MVEEKEDAEEKAVEMTVLEKAIPNLVTKEDHVLEMIKTVDLKAKKENVLAAGEKI